LKPNHNGITDSHIWFDEDKLKNKLMVNSMGSMLVERPIKIEFIDIPRVYNPIDPLAAEFFASLADTENYELFSVKPI
jgi:hypothetical protein